MKKEVLKIIKLPFFVILSVLLVDQITKILVKTNMLLGEEINVIGNWFYIHFTENKGMAFGLEFSGEYGKLILSIFRIVAIVIISWYIYKLCKEKAHKGLIFSVSLILAGAIGNMIDSAFYGIIFSESPLYIHGLNSTNVEPAVLFPKEGGYASFLHGKVVDMLYFPIISGKFPDWLPIWGGEDFVFFRPVFNVADSAITIGVALIIIFQKKFFPKNKLEKEKIISN